MLVYRNVVLCRPLQFTFGGRDCVAGTAAVLLLKSVDPMAVASFTQNAVIITIVWTIGIKVDFVLSNVV